MVVKNSPTNTLLFKRGYNAVSSVSSQCSRSLSVRTRNKHRRAETRDPVLPGENRNDRLVPSRATASGEENNARRNQGERGCFVCFTCNRPLLHTRRWTLPVDFILNTGRPRMVSATVAILEKLYSIFGVDLLMKYLLANTC